MLTEFVALDPSRSQQARVRSRLAVNPHLRYGRSENPAMPCDSCKGRTRFLPAASIRSKTRNRKLLPYNRSWWSGQVRRRDGLGSFSWMNQTFAGGAPSGRLSPSLWDREPRASSPDVSSRALARFEDHDAPDGCLAPAPACAGADHEGLRQDDAGHVAVHAPGDQRPSGCLTAPGMPPGAGRYAARPAQQPIRGSGQSAHSRLRRRRR